MLTSQTTLHAPFNGTTNYKKASYSFERNCLSYALPIAYEEFKLFSMACQTPGDTKSHCRGTKPSGFTIRSVYRVISSKTRAGICELILTPQGSRKRWRSSGRRRGRRGKVHTKRR